jgi:hypothetical protein
VRAEVSLSSAVSPTASHGSPRNRNGSSSAMLWPPAPRRHTRRRIIGVDEPKPAPAGRPASALPGPDRRRGRLHAGRARTRGRRPLAAIPRRVGVWWPDPPAPSTRRRTQAALSRGEITRLAKRLPVQRTLLACFRRCGPGCIGGRVSRLRRIRHRPTSRALPRSSISTRSGTTSELTDRMLIFGERHCGEARGVCRALQRASAASSAEVAFATAGIACLRVGVRQDPASTGPRRPDQRVRTRSLKPLVTGRGRGSGTNRYRSPVPSPQRFIDGAFRLRRSCPHSEPIIDAGNRRGGG